MLKDCVVLRPGRAWRPSRTKDKDKDKQQQPLSVMRVELEKCGYVMQLNSSMCSITSNYELNIATFHRTYTGKERHGAQTTTTTRACTPAGDHRLGVVGTWLRIHGGSRN
jgi:hypothetical protein